MTPELPVHDCEKKGLLNLSSPTWSNFHKKSFCWDLARNSSNCLSKLLLFHDFTAKVSFSKSKKRVSQGEEIKPSTHFSDWAVSEFNKQALCQEGREPRTDYTFQQFFSRPFSLSLSSTVLFLSRPFPPLFSSRKKGTLKRRGTRKRTHREVSEGEWNSERV